MTEEHLTRTRYRLPAPLQLYLRAKPHPTGFREAHAHYYLRLAQEQNRKLEGPEQSDALSEMTIELDNFRALCSGLRRRTMNGSCLGNLLLLSRNFSIYTDYGLKDWDG